MTIDDRGHSPLSHDQQTVMGLLKAGAAILLFVLIIWAVPRFLHLVPKIGLDQVDADLQCQTVSVYSAADLANALRRFHLFDVDANEVLVPVLFEHFPADFGDVSPVLKHKKMFFHTLLPIALIVRQEILSERNTLLSILSQYSEPDIVKFRIKNSNWQQKLDKTQIQQALFLVKKYKADSAKELLKRIQPVPISLILAQSAIESAWGTSRFALAGNNLFGIWTWDDNDAGLVPRRRENGKTHRVKSFDSLLSAVREYSLILNSNPAYGSFRQIRLGTSDSRVMAAGLRNYSSRRSLYVRDVQAMIRLNKLQRYDTCKLQGVTNDG